MPNALLDFLQGASNSAASTVSAPVDGLAWLLRKAGMNVGEPVGGSDWMARQGLTREPQNALAGGAGELFGGLLPIGVAAKAGQVARGMNLLQDATTIAPSAAQRLPSPSNQLGAIDVFHGSPHQFDKFDMSKLGTGEGAQAYGHGLYFAENPGTAKAYADNVKDMGAVTRINAEMSSLADIMHADQIPGSYRTFRTDAGRQAAERYDALMAQRSAGLKAPGQMYETRLAWPDAAREAADPLGPQHFLNWDARLSEQHLPQNLMDAYDSAKGGFLTRDAQGGAGNSLWGYARQRAFQEGGATSYADEARLAAEWLRQSGIPGIRYLDGGSRGAGAGTSNYVVFDDRIPTITGRR